MKLLITFSALSILLLTNLSQAGELAYECHSLKEKNGFDISVYIEKIPKYRGHRYEYIATISNMDETLVENEPVTNENPPHLRDKFISKQKTYRRTGKSKWNLEIYELDRGILLGLLVVNDKSLDDKIKDLEIHCTEYE